MIKYIVEIDSAALRIISLAKGRTKCEIPIAKIHPKEMQDHLTKKGPRPSLK